ncbi:magnesium transporter [Candidatus Bathyarchaeota archaeon]|nr:magnesium transporter [Candidatus Bathyarchaeota archaeon]
MNHHPQYSLSKTFRECLLSFNFDFLGLIAGGVLAAHMHIFRLSPWVITTYPAVLSAKGIIAGILAGRLGTALHIGIIYPKFIGNTRSFYTLLSSLITMTLIISVFMSLIGSLIGLFLWGISLIDMPNIVLSVIGTMALGLTISLLTIFVSFVSFKRGLDPDIVVYPVMSTTADVIITVYYIIVVIIFFLNSIGKAIIISINAIYLIFSALILLRNLHNKEFIKNIREVFLTLLIVSFIVNFTGTFLGKISAVIEERREVYIVYPSLIDMIGDVGSVVGSVTTTKLALGLLSPSLSSLKGIKEQVFGSWLASIIIFVILSFLSLIMGGALEISSFITFTLTLFMANFIAIPVISLLSYSVSIETFKRGFDPDNFVIPIESSLADNLTTIALFISLLVIYR